MKTGYESELARIQEDMIAICLEYIENKCDTIYIYASCEKKAISCNFFFDINGEIYKKHQLPNGYNTNMKRQMSCLKILANDVEELMSICIEYETDMPTEMKIVYDMKNNKVSACYKYECVYANTDKSANDIFECWYQQVRQNI